MRILHLHDEPWDSGIAHYAVTLAAGLAARGHSIGFFGRTGSPAAAQARAAGLKTREVLHPWLSLPFLRRVVRQGRFEVLVAHTGSSHSLAAALAAGSTARLVRTCADARLPRGHALARALSRRTDAYVAANSAIAAHLRRAFPGARVEVVLQGVAAQPGPPAALPQEPVVGLLGRLDPVKGHEILIDAAARVQARGAPVRLRFAGSGRLAEAIRGMARSRLCPGSYEVLGRVADPGPFLASCRVGCVPSLGSEAVSRAALEWMASGRPVVASAVGGLPDVVEHGKTGLLVAPGDPDALAGALARLLQDPDTAARLAARARARYDERFTLEAFVRSTEAVYQGVPAARPAGAAA